MNHGGDAQRDVTALEDALVLLIATFDHNKIFFGARLPHSYERLRHLVRYCRHHRRTLDPALTQAVIQEDLQRLFGVRVAVPQARQLSLLAALIRHVLVSYVRMQQRLNTRGGVQVLMNEIHRQVDGALPGAVDLLAVDAALKKLAQRYLYSVRLLELRYFARLGLRDIALELGVTLAQVERDLRFAKACLLAYLQCAEG